MEKDPSKLMDVALALRDLNAEYGPFPHIIGRGPAAKIVADNYMQVCLDTRFSVVGLSYLGTEVSGPQFSVNNLSIHLHLYRI